jgi:hypothetical protein
MVQINADIPLRRIGVFIFFLALYMFSLFGIYKYFEWLFAQELLTTAGIIGVVLVIPILMVEAFYTFVTVVILKVIANA